MSPPKVKYWGDSWKKIFEAPKLSSNLCHRFTPLVLDVQTWPQELDARYGEKEIRCLCIVGFNLDAQSAVVGMRDFVDDSSSIPDALKGLSNCLRTLP
jgi:hypothetical protein